MIWQSFLKMLPHLYSINGLNLNWPRFSFNFQLPIFEHFWWFLSIFLGFSPFLDGSELSTSNQNKDISIFGFSNINSLIYISVNSQKNPQSLNGKLTGSLEGLSKRQKKRLNRRLSRSKDNTPETIIPSIPENVLLDR